MDTNTTAANATTDTHYAYDSLGRLDSVTQDRRNGAAITAETTDYVYDLLGNLDQVRLPNGVVSDYDYDDLNRLVSLQEFNDTDLDGVLDQGENLLAQFDYELLADGRRSGVTETDDADQTTSIDWFYDNLGRLTREVYDSYDNDLDFTADYTYDLAGNRLTKKTDSDPDSTLLTAYRAGTAMDSGDVDEAIDYAYDANDRLLTETKDDLTSANQDTYTVYGYGTGNAATQQTHKTVHLGDDVTDPVIEDDTYTYNLQGRMASAEVEKFDSTGQTLTEHTLSEYKYDDDGIRVEQKVSTDVNLDGDFVDAEDTVETTKYLNDGNNPTGYSQVLIERVNEAIARSYVLGLDVVSQALANGTVHFLLADGHGSTRMLVDATGAVITTPTAQVFRYDAFGNPIGFNPTNALTSHLYNSEPFLGSVGLYDFRDRLYDPRIGRFPTSDRFFGDLNNPWTFNKYVFCHGDGVNFSDPTGMYDIDFHYYVIQYILRSLGWPADLTHSVARWSQYVDDNYSTEAVYREPKNGLDAGAARRAEFHFYGSTALSAAVVDDQGARNNLTAAISGFYATYKPGELDQYAAALLGSWLHTYADTFSHAGFTAWYTNSINVREGSGRFNIGHWDAAYDGHAPDMLSLNRENHDKALDAIHQIYTILSQGSPFTPVQSESNMLQKFDAAFYCFGCPNTFGSEGTQPMVQRLISLINSDFSNSAKLYQVEEISNNNTFLRIFTRVFQVRTRQTPTVTPLGQPIPHTSLGDLGGYGYIM